MRTAFDFAPFRRSSVGFDRLYPVNETPCFGDLLRAIDEADRALRCGDTPRSTQP